MPGHVEDVLSRFPLPRGQRLGCVDGLRGFLALFVLVYHFLLFVEVTRLGGSWERPHSTLDSFGPGSVNLFFMATGLLFYPRILNATNWPTLYVGRAFRILPLVVFSVLVASLIALMRMDFRPAAPFAETLGAIFRWIACWDQPDLFGYRDSAMLNASVLWSLWYEWLFYLFVLPACAIAMRFRGSAPTWAVPTSLIIGSLALRPLHLLQLIQFLPLFGVGMLAYELRGRITDSWGAGIAAIALFVVGAMLGGPLRMLCHSLFFICIASGVSLFGLLRARISRILGEISYGVYLLHGLVLNIVFVSFAQVHAYVPTWAAPIMFPVVIAVVVGCAAASFLLLERPAIQLGKALVARRSTFGAKLVEAASAN